MSVRLTGLAIHSQHSGQYHAARALRLEAIAGDRRTTVIDRPLTSVDETVTFPETTSSRWSLTLTAGASRILVIRGLQFFDGNDEVCPHMFPYPQTMADQNPPASDAGRSSSSSSK